MITVGFSTRKDNPEYIKHLRKMFSNPKIEVIQKINNGEKSLNQTYNEILSESTYDKVVLLHDDLIIDTKNLTPKILKIFEKNPEYGIIGVAGTTHLSETGRWWDNTNTMKGIVNHKQDGKIWESKYSSNSGNIDDVVIVDGLFLVIDKTKIKHNFDETFSGFHFYDLGFTFKNFIDGVKIGVTYDIRVTHLSIGQTNNQWEENRVIFSNMYKDILPQKVEVKSDLTTFIVCHDENIIKSNITSNKYGSLGNVIFMYVGNGNFNEIEKYNNVIIVKDLKYNIEQYPNFTAFTAWYAIWKNNLCKSKYINLLEYDTNITDNYSFLLNNILSKSPKIVSYFPLSMRNYHFINNKDWVTSIFNGIKKIYKIDMFSHMNNVINNIIKQNQEPIWPTTNNVCFDRNLFEKYMKWIEPMLLYMKNDEYAGHNQERALIFFSVLNNIQIKYFIDEIQHIQADSHKTQGHVVKEGLVL